jgi:hypothetical protein
MKTVNTSRKKAVAKVSRTPTYEFHYNIHKRTDVVVTEKTIEDLAKDFYTWANQEDSLRIDDFIDIVGFSKTTFYKWVDLYPELKRALEYALRRIASRREIGASTRKYDSNSIYKTLAFYDEIYRGEQKRVSELKLEAEKADMNRKLTIELDIVEKTGLVKPLEKK